MYDSNRSDEQHVSSSNLLYRSLTEGSAILLVILPPRDSNQRYETLAAPIVCKVPSFMEGSILGAIV